MQQHLLKIVLWFLLATACGLCQDIESGLAGIILDSQGVCATQSYIVEGPSFDPGNDGLVPATELRTTGSPAGKRLQSFLLPWTPCIAGATLNSSRALATGVDGSLHGVYENGIEFALGPRSFLTTQSAFYPARFQLKSGELWLATHDQSVTVKTAHSQVVGEAGSTFFLRSGGEQDELIVVEGEVTHQGQCQIDEGPVPWVPARSHLESLRRGQLQLASEELRHTNEFSDLLLRAALENALRRPERAMEFYRACLEKEPLNSRTLFLQAILEARSGRLEEALTALKSIDGPYSSVAVALRGHLLTQANRKEEARALLEVTLDSAQGLDPFVERMLKMARARVVGRAEAAKILREIQAKHAGDPFLANNLGVYLAAGGRLKEGLGQLEKAKRIAPLIPIIRQNIGTLYLLAGQVGRAQSEFAVLSLYAPDSGVARQGLAFAFDQLGSDSMGNRLLAQSTALDPLLIAPGRGEIVLNGTYRTDLAPESFVNITRRLGGMAVSLSNETGNATLVTENASSIEVGLPLGKKGNLAGLVARRGSEFELGATREEPFALLMYENKLGDDTRVWAAGSFHGPLSETELPVGLRRAKEQNYRFEARVDRRLSPRQAVSAGVSHLHGKSLAQGRGLEVTGERTTERVWAQGRQLLGRKAILTAGVGLDRLRGANTKVDPYLGLVVVPDEKTTLSLAALRQSDIPLISDSRISGQVQLLEDPLIATTGLFPLRRQEVEFVRLNSPDLLPLPYWDYRLQLRRSLSDEVYGVLELYQTEVLPSDVAGQTNDPLLAGRPASGRSRLRGASLQADFQRKRTFANLFYRYRDYAHDDGGRWVLVPRHELGGQVLVPLAKGLSLGVLPVYQAGLQTPAGETDLASLSAFLRIPIDRGSLNLGYLNLISSDREIAEGSVLVNLILKF